MKRTNQSVRSVETGRAAGDYNRSQSITWKNKGGRNASTEEGRHAKSSPLAPRPRAMRQDRIASSSPTAPTTGSLARVKDSRSSATGTSGGAGSFTPVRNNAMANLKGTASPYGGNGTPPAQRGGPAGIRAGGRNQTWPNGAMYTDAAKRGSSGKDSGPLATRMPKRRGRGAAFYGEYS